MRRKRQQDEQAPAVAVYPHAEDDKIEITSIVTKRLSSADVEDVEEAMFSLVALLNSDSNINADENRKTAVRRGALLAILQAMYRNEQSAVIQSNGLSCLTNISCCTVADYKPDIIESETLKCIIWAMGRHLHDPSVQSAGCSVLGNLWLNPNHRKFVIDRGGLKAVVNAMKNHKEHLKVQLRGCRALGILLDAESPTLAKAATDEDSGCCIELVISAMNKHPDNVKIQKDGCSFLRRLANAHAVYRKMVLDAEGLIPVANGLRIHQDDAAVKRAARMAFKAISH